METTAGSWALLGSIVPRDAQVVARLRQAGALLLGKATLSEWADMRSSNYSEGYSARGGQARSPYNLTLNPGGSSSGSAGAVAGNLCMFALGTETDGSGMLSCLPGTRHLAVHLTPFYSHQPSRKERSSRYQAHCRADISCWVPVSFRSLWVIAYGVSVIPESTHQDTVGTFARTVRDAVYVLDAIYGTDLRDNYTSAQQSRTPLGGYSQFLTTSDALQNATFGLPWHSFWALASAEQQLSLVGLIRLIESAGATVINGTELPNYQTIVSPNGWNWCASSPAAPKIALSLTVSTVGITGQLEDIRTSQSSLM